MKTRLALAVAFLSAQAAAQYVFTDTVILSPDGFTGWNFGLSSCAMDMDGDGFDDLVAFEPGGPAGGLAGAGRGWIFYGPGLDQFVKLEARHPVAEEQLGSGTRGCTIGDVNGDGHPDVLVSAEFFGTAEIEAQGRAHVFLGPDYVTCIPLHDPTPQAGGRMGYQAVKLADLDGDGLDDAFVGVPWACGPALQNIGEAFVWWGRSLTTSSGAGLPVHIPSPFPAMDSFFGVAPYVADFLSDGHLDLFLGNGTLADYPGCLPQTWGMLHVVDGPSLLPVATFCPPPITGLGPFGTVAFHGDLDRDGTTEIVVPLNTATVSCSDAGEILILGGAQFQDVKQALVSPTACSGKSTMFGSYTNVKDIDQDGWLDIVTSENNIVQGFERVHIFYGPTFSTVQSLGGDLAAGITSSAFGFEITLGDFDGDGFPEVACYAGQGNAMGSVYIFDLQTLVADVDSVSVAAGGQVHFELNAGIGEAGNVYVGVLGVSGAAPGVVAGPGVYVPLNVDSVTFAGLSLLGSPVLQDFTGTLDPSGRAAMTLNLPAGFPSPLIGKTLTICAVTIHPDGRLGMGSSAASVGLLP